MKLGNNPITRFLDLSSYKKREAFINDLQACQQLLVN